MKIDLTYGLSSLILPVLCLTSDIGFGIRLVLILVILAFLALLVSAVQKKMIF